MYYSDTRYEFAMIGVRDLVYKVYKSFTKKELELQNGWNSDMLRKMDAQSGKKGLLCVVARAFTHLMLDELIKGNTFKLGTAKYIRLSVKELPKEKFLKFALTSEKNPIDILNTGGTSYWIYCERKRKTENYQAHEYFGKRIQFRGLHYRKFNENINNNLINSAEEKTIYDLIPVLQEKFEMLKPKTIAKFITFFTAKLTFYLSKGATISLASSQRYITPELFENKRFTVKHCSKIIMSFSNFDKLGMVRSYAVKVRAGFTKKPIEDLYLCNGFNHYAFTKYKEVSNLFSEKIKIDKTIMEKLGCTEVKYLKYLERTPTTKKIYEAGNTE